MESRPRKFIDHVFGSGRGDGVSSGVEGAVEATAWHEQTVPVFRLTLSASVLIVIGRSNGRRALHLLGAYVAALLSFAAKEVGLTVFGLFIGKS